MRFVYPNGLKKALTFSYDDARTYDRRLVQILNQYGMKGTFHLNSGKLGMEGYIAADEVADLYRGHEVACHGVEHRNPAQLPLGALNVELGDDRRNLERLTGKMVQGMSYAYGAYSEEVKAAARMHGILYSRTTKATNRYFPPSDFLEWHPTCHHSGMMDCGREFLNVAGYYEMPLLYVWGHSYEFGIPDEWDKLEEFCRMMAGRDDIWYATNLEICAYVRNTRRQEFSADGKTMYNPTSTTVWVENDAVLAAVAPGETCRFE